jgi:hypothetical protein
MNPLFSDNRGVSCELRPAEASDERFLREMLYLALFVPSGPTALPRSVLADPAISRYIESWEKRSGDFCYHCHLARLSEEVAFFQKRIGPNVALARLMKLRTAYQPSLAFILGCIPTLVRLHLSTAWDNFSPGPAWARSYPFQPAFDRLNSCAALPVFP